ncbi:non-heme chloroperoxidase [Sporosarcina luteola]|nr:non-heme chloroperoxidase [Sporosarcina luteola]
MEDLNPLGDKTILFLHGWPLSHKQFEYQFTILPEKGYRCIGIDWRGFGNSDKPYNGYTLDRLADDIHFVVEALQLESFVLVGHSTGGAIAVRYMSRHKGDRVSRLVLVDAAAPTGFTKPTAERYRALSLHDRPKLMQEVIDGFFFRYITAPFSDWFFQIGMQAAGWSTAAIIILLRDLNLTQDLSYIHIPTLIIHGIHDKVIPFSQAQEVHKLIPQSQLVPFYYSGHGAFWEEQNRFNFLLEQFIR